MAAGRAPLGCRPLPLENSGGGLRGLLGRVRISKLIIMIVPDPALVGRGWRTRRQLAKSWYIFFFQLPWIPEWGLARRGCEAIGRVFRDMAVDKARFPDEVLRVYRVAAAAPGA